MFDTSMDIAAITFRQGDFLAEAQVGREVLWDLDLLKNQERSKIENTLLYIEYRGIEDSKLAAYAIKRKHRTSPEAPVHLGVRMAGRPSDSFNYWIERALTRGRDENNHKLKGSAFDVGAQYRFLGLPLQPSVALSYAVGTGDANPDDDTNYEFRQTGLQSNEARFSGVTQFKAYGEVLDPELTNLRIFTAGGGFRAAGEGRVGLG